MNYDDAVWQRPLPEPDHDDWQRHRQPPSSGASKAVVLWAVTALILLFTGLGVALGYHHFHPGMGGVTASSTTNSESAPAPYEEAYLGDLHTMSARIPAMAWGRSDRRFESLETSL